MIGATMLIAVLAAGLGMRHRLPSAQRITSLGPDTTATRDDRDWSSFLDSVATGVRAGRSLREAFIAASGHVPSTARALTPGTALHLVPTRVTVDPDEAVAIQTLSVASSLGGPTAVVLQSGAVLLRERATIRAEAAAHAAQARLSARVLTAVPLVFATWGAVASSSFRAALTNPFGTVAALVGLALNLVGWWWMRRIVRRAAA